MSYDEAVEEELCLGWIDSIAKSADEQTYAQKFTPRKDLIVLGKMTPAGLAPFERHEGRLVEPHPTELPKKLETAFKSHKIAGKNFLAFPPGYRRTAIAWVASAKREETQLKRLYALIEVPARRERMKYV